LFFDESQRLKKLFLFMKKSFVLNVGIGTNNPTETLSVYGPNAIMSVRSTTTNGQGFMEVMNNSGDAAGVMNYGSGHASAGHSTFYGDGTVHLMAGAAGTSSDILFETGTTAFTPGQQVRMKISAAGRVGVGTATPNTGSILDLYGTGTQFSSLVVPRETTALRPTGVNGMIRYNTTTQKFEVYEGVWQNMVNSSGGAAGLLYFTEGIASAGVNSTTPAASLTPNDTNPDVDFVIAPKGSGAILAQVPDGTNAGGDKRSDNAVDFQTLRASSDQVALGYASVIAGGGENKTDSSYSVVSGGLGNTASGAKSSITGGELNTSSGLSASILGGSVNIASGNYSAVLGGKDNNVSASYSLVGGNLNTVSSLYSIALGGQSNTASNTYSTSIGGNGNSTSGEGAAVVGGSVNSATGDFSFVAGGTDNLAGGMRSFAAGAGVSSPNYAQITVGIFNIAATGSANSLVASDPIFVVGNGTGPSARSNALTILKSGAVGLATASPTGGAALDIFGTGSGFSSLIVPRDTRGEFESHYVFQAGDHMGGTIHMSCRRER
jgi:hypothetical protein